MSCASGFDIEQYHHRPGWAMVCNRTESVFCYGSEYLFAPLYTCSRFVERLACMPYVTATLGFFITLLMLHHNSFGNRIYAYVILQFFFSVRTYLSSFSSHVKPKLVSKSRTMGTANSTLECYEKSVYSLNWCLVLDSDSGRKEVGEALVPLLFNPRLD